MRIELYEKRIEGERRRRYENGRSEKKKEDWRGRE